MHVVRSVLIPVLAAYALLAGAVIYASRHPDAGPPERSVVGWGPRLRLIAATIVGGYVCFLAIVLVLQEWVVGQRGVMRSAIRDGGFLAAVCAAVFVIGSAITSR